ncbi:MAG: hypothetical protein K2N33_05640, partial [Clostridia bacterium]|nr:hypothetical protein [Clostridia bacterium]
YNRNKMGTYSIRVSYEGKTASYDVNVSEAKLIWAPAQDFKDLYLVGEELQNLKEHGTFTVETQRPGEAVSTKTDVTDKVTINSSSFDNTKEGAYSINATYRLPALAAGFTANYPVSTLVYANVIETREGLNVELDQGVDSIIPLSATMSTATIDPSKIVVKRVDDYGAVIDTPLSTSDYTVKLFKENEEVSDSHLSGNVYTGLTGGVYQLWAYADSLKGNTDYKLSGFAVIIVADKVNALTVNQNGYTSQEVGLDYLSTRWIYTVSYISGASKVVTHNDVSFLQFDTKTVATNKRARATYTETNAAGEEASASFDFYYTINQSTLTSLPTESFIVKNIDDAANKFATVTPTDSDGLGGIVNDNALFTITTQAEMKWAEAKGSATSANTKWITTTLQDESSITFDAGLSQSSVANPTESTPSLTFTAKTDITLKAYLTLCNAPYNSDRSGTLIATITHADKSVTVHEINGVGADRSVWNDKLVFDLYEGDVLVITIRNDANGTATMWLFGAEAIGYKAVSSVEGD